MNDRTVDDETTDDVRGIFIQMEEPYKDVFVGQGDRWTRSQAAGSVFVYSNEEAVDDPLAEVDAEYFVSAGPATREQIEEMGVDYTTSDAEVSPS